MIFKVVPLKVRGEHYDGIIAYSDKYARDEVDEMVDAMKSTHRDSISKHYGPFTFIIRPRTKGAARVDE